MTPAEVVRRSADYLARHGVESPRETAEVLLMSVLGTDRAGIYSRSEGLDLPTARRYGRALCRRCAGEPLQYVTGEQAFMGLTLTVGPGVFVPRPETEALVELALERLAGVESPMVVDVGTGAGAIALAVAAGRQDARVVATDRSADAVRTAAANAERLGLAVEVRRGDLLEPVPAELRGSLDLLVSNPPYLTPEEHAAAPPDVRAEPAEALVGGTAVHGRLAEAAAEWLRPGGWLLLEIGEAQGTDVAALLASSGLTEVDVHPDLAGRDRVAEGRRPPVG